MQDLSHSVSPRATTGSSKLLAIVLLLIAILVIIFAASKVFKPAPTPFARAQALIKAGKAAAAVPILEELSFQHPDNSALLPWLAQGYLACDRVAEGRIALDTALRMGLPVNDVVPAVMAYASYYERKGDFAEAEKLLQSSKHVCPVATINAALVQVYFDWAQSLRSQNQLKEAVEKYELANELKQFAIPHLASLLIEHLSEGLRELSVFTENEDAPQAIALLERSLKVKDDPSTRMLLANLYAQQHDCPKAIINYELVVQVDKANLEARHRLIDLLIETNDYSRAQAALTELTEQEKSIENDEQLARVDLKLGNYPGAVRALEDASELGNKPEVLQDLLAVLNEWSAILTKEKKLQEAASVQGHANRVSELLAQVGKDETKNANNVPIALVSSRTWLAPGSVTPEGEIKIKNISGKSLPDLTLVAVFYDNTADHASGSVTLPVANPNSLPFAVDESRTLYFSCPNIVKSDHQLAVLLFWQNRFLRELPVTKGFRR